MESIIEASSASDIRLELIASDHNGRHRWQTLGEAVEVHAESI